MEDAHLWPELVFLYTHYDEYDNASLAMMERAADAWEHQTFKETIVKVSNLEIYYKWVDPRGPLYLYRPAVCVVTLGCDARPEIMQLDHPF